MYAKTMSEKRRLRYEGLFKACEDLAPGEGKAFVYDTKEEAKAARESLYNHLRIRGLIVHRKVQKIGNDLTKFWLQNTRKACEVVEITSDIGILKRTLKPYDNEEQIIIVDFLRDSKLLTTDQAVKLTTFCQKNEHPGEIDTNGRNFEKPKENEKKKIFKLKGKKSDVREAIVCAAEKFPTPELTKENPVLNPFDY